MCVCVCVYIYIYIISSSGNRHLGNSILKTIVLKVLSLSCFAFSLAMKVLSDDPEASH